MCVDALNDEHVSLAAASHQNHVATEVLTWRRLERLYRLEMAQEHRGRKELVRVLQAHTVWALAGDDKQLRSGREE